MGDLLNRLKHGVPQREERWPGNDGSDFITDVLAANKTMGEAALVIENLADKLQQRISVYKAMKPEEDESWESWYCAALDLISSEIDILKTGLRSNA